MDWQENRGSLNTLYMAAFHIPSKKTSMSILFIVVLELSSFTYSCIGPSLLCIGIVAENYKKKEAEKNKMLLSSLFEKVEPL